MSRNMTLTLVLGVSFIIAGCGGGSKPSTAPYPMPPVSTPAVKQLPAEYRTLAQQLVLPLYFTPEGFRDNIDLSELMAVGHSGIVALRGIQSSDPDITYITAYGEAALSEGFRRLEKINELPRPPGAGELFVSSFIDGLFGNVYGGYSRGLDAEGQQKKIIAEFYSLAATLEKIDAAQLMLPKVAERYSASMCDSTKRIIVDLDESWGCFGPHDWLSISNSGPTLEDCTIIVQLTASDGKMRTNLHFMQNWPENASLYARYEQGRAILEKQIGRTTVTRIKQVDVTIYSPKFATVSRYIYEGQEKDNDFARRCKDLKFTGRYQPFVPGLIWDDERAAHFTMTGIEGLPECKVDVTFRSAEQAKGWSWSFDSWKKDEQKSFATAKGDLTFEPNIVEMSISFAGTNYRHEVELTVNK